MSILNLPKILLIIVLAILPIGAQENGPFGWDLSYKSVLERNSVHQSDWIWQWLKRSSPAEKWIADWQGQPIISAILIEHPAFHAAERTTMLLVRTSDAAHYWEFVEGRKNANQEVLAPGQYDALFQRLTSWRQHTPKPAGETPKDALPGYLGFLSVSDKYGSKQMLLTLEDFSICLDKSCLPGKIKMGRLMAALRPIVSPDDGYKHKPETEIARMTPRQRIDEEIRESDHMMDSSDKQGDLIRKYRLRDGLKSLPRLIELMDGYDPKRQRDTRFHTAMRIAKEIDYRTIRLRSDAEGLRTIDEMERLSARMRAAGDDDEMVRMAIKSTRGINQTDEAIRDTLWMKYRIKMSDSELLEFSNYLVKRNPTYPSWSEKDFVKDYSRKNEAGYPAQVYIFKKPMPYYRQYRAFKRQASLAAMR